jgi:hypothetical protein
MAAMGKLAHLVQLVAAMVLALAVTSSAADAVTWHNTGSESFHATGGPSTLSAFGWNLACSGSTATGTAPVGSFPSSYSVSGSITSRPCSIAATFPTSYVTCGYTMTAVAWTAAWTGAQFDMTRDVRFIANDMAFCHIGGMTAGLYFNPSGTTPGRVTLVHSSTLVITHSSGTSCPLAVGIGTLTEQTITLTAGGPILTRTP